MLDGLIKAGTWYSNVSHTAQNIWLFRECIQFNLVMTFRSHSFCEICCVCMARRRCTWAVLWYNTPYCVYYAQNVDFNLHLSLYKVCLIQGFTWNYWDNFTLWKCVFLSSSYSDVALYLRYNLFSMRANANDYYMMNGNNPWGKKEGIK